jgi:hypothetical protein
MKIIKEKTATKLLYHIRESIDVILKGNAVFYSTEEYLESIVGIIDRGISDIEENSTDIITFIEDIK